ncbi:MAG: ATP-binding protein [Nitrospirota bacterium]
MKRPFLFLRNLPIERKLLLTSVGPILWVVLLSAFTYQSVQTYAEDEEQLNNAYLVQRRAAEYLRLVVDLETGFRGFVLTKQELYLRPYLKANDRIQTVGDTLELMVHDRAVQHALVREVQQLVKRLISDKERLIAAIRSSHEVDALHYIEQGRGREIMTAIREKMDQFDRLEQDALNEALTKLSRDRSFLLLVILGGGTLALLLMLVTLHLIARSITGPLVALAKAVGSATGGAVPDVPVLDRGDEIGGLTRVMGAMSAQIRDHIAQIEKSEAELRAVNQNLSASEANYRSIVDHAPIGIFTTKGMPMVFANRYNRALAGLDPDEESDPEAIRQAIHPEDRERVLTEYAKAVEQDQPYETVFRFLHKDGTVRKVLSRRIPIRNAEGQTVMYQGFNVDITALDQLQSRLNRAERLATLGQVAAGIAHEIRNPLVGIGSTLALLLEETDASDSRRADLETILREAKRLDRIVNQIIDYASPRQLAPMEFALEELVQEALALQNGALAKKRVRVERQLHPHLSRLHADRDQLKQVLINVFQNAAEALNEVGTLRITAFDVAREQEAGILMRVANTGRLVAPGDLPRVFEPFFTSGKHRGTGLGLAICRKIIEAHRGTIELDSQPGVGTTVQIWVPRRQPMPMGGC